MRSRAVTWLGLTLAAALVAACGPSDPATTAGVGSPEPASSQGLNSGIPNGLRGLAVTTVVLGSLELEVAVADSPAERTAGLAGVDDLGPLDGLLFVFPSTVETGFTMRGTLLPLDLAWLDEDGRVLAVTRLEVCEAEPCPPYPPPGPYRWALETPAGGLASVEPGDPFSIQP